MDDQSTNSHVETTVVRQMTQRYLKLLKRVQWKIAGEIWKPVYCKIQNTDMHPGLVTNNASTYLQR